MTFDEIVRAVRQRHEQEANTEFEAMLRVTTAWLGDMKAAFERVLPSAEEAARAFRNLKEAWPSDLVTDD